MTCYNCIKEKLQNVNHRANDPKCPSKKEYLLVRRKVTQKQLPSRDSKKISNVLNTSVDDSAIHGFKDPLL